MDAIDIALEGLIDYAGLYPPAGLDMPAAVGNYLAYARQKHAPALGRFIVDLSRLDALREAAGDDLGRMRLSVIAAPHSDLDRIVQHRDEGFRIESVEIKCDQPLTMARTCEHLPANMECYFEIPLQSGCSGAIDALASVGARAKLRMGGVVAEAFPTAAQVVDRLCLLADRRVPFKATAGLHHPLRSRHSLTYAPESPTGTMHGFMNLLCAAALLHFGGEVHEAISMLEEEDPGAFRITPDYLSAHGHQWNAQELREVRQFFTGFGSCSFTEPMRDLEALGWL
ncbi:MAG TPA: hypothetical protein VG225_04560 [Terracidiphilus sp.]|jgi:hypothetical protein|nr:hypothetical protein [Terracidiphilus sp.]